MADGPRASPALTAEIAGAMASGAGRVLGSGYQASVHLYRTSVGDVVVKLPHRGGPLGAIWRSLLRREHAVYERLHGVAGIPRSFGLVGDGLALEYVAGPSLREHDGELVDREAFFAKLKATVEAMHERGIAHGDLKRKNNIIVGAGEQPYIIDFGIAVRRSARSASFNRWVFEQLEQMDLNAWVKLKYRRRIDLGTERDALSAEDAAIYKPHWIERLARAVRVPWQTITLRRPRQRWRARRNGDES
ncbi:MAG TPA: RIO1 family regulatory kinase/ATPase [Gammaproteobacteria bacterium]|nr:RIO1 family regulatory kinase/ATPase [Gammaproteobacteria bacterium]